jgi:hypothetical protein
MLDNASIDDVFDLIERDKRLVEYLIKKFGLKPLSEVLNEDSICLKSIDPLSEGLEFEVFRNKTNSFLKLTLPDTSYDLLRKLKGYREGFEDAKPKRVFMNEPEYDRRYRILLGLQVAMQMVYELKTLKIGAIIDLRLIHTANGSDFAGFILYPVDGEAELIQGLLPSLSVWL